MHENATGTPISARPRDWFFVVAFSLFAFSSIFSDAWHGLGLIDETSFWGRANLWYGRVAGDDFLMADHEFPRLNTWISGFIYGPFYIVLVYAFVKGANWVRVPALIYVGSMLHGYVEFMWWEYALGSPPRVPAVFWAFNAPYGIVPILLAARMWRPRPFATRDSAAPDTATESMRPLTA
jgi:hypothetical protein